MHLLMLATLMLFTNGSIDYHQAQQSQSVTKQESQHTAETQAPATVQQAHTNSERSDYDPRQDCLYRLYLFATVIGVAGGIVGVALIFWQVRLLRQTVDSASEQSKAMNRHIGEAARSADAMEDIATKIQEGNKAILRAYLTVTVGAIHLYQERQDNKKFEARPNLTNAGNTPARNVSIRITANILPIPIPGDFQFPLPGGETKNAGIVGPREVMALAGTVDHFVPDEEIGTIKEGRTKALCVWGLITYDDIFGASHYTKFGQWITWNPNGAIFGYYLVGQNDSD